MPLPYRLKSIRYCEAFRDLSGQFFEAVLTAYSFSNAAHERDFCVLQDCLLSLDLTIVHLRQVGVPSSVGRT